MPLRRMGLRTVAVALLAPLLAGCVSYVPIAADRVTPGSQVRVRVAAGASGTLEHVLGYPVSELRGEALANRGDTLLLQVAGAAARGGEAAPFRQNVRLAPGQFQDVELQRVNWTKTGFVAGGAALVGGILVASLFHASQRNNQNNPKPLPNSARLPFLGFTIHP